MPFPPKFEESPVAASGLPLKTSFADEVFASIVVCFAQVPACVAFAALAHCPPLVGLHAAWMVGLPCALCGGRPAMIVGSAGALASVTRHFMSPDGSGIEELFLSISFAGVLIVAAGMLGAGSFVEYVPESVMMGFCNGLAVVIGGAQLEWFHVNGTGPWLQGMALNLTLAHALIALLIVAALPRITQRLPAHLTALVLGIILEWLVFRIVFTGVETETLGDRSAFARDDILPRPFFLNPHYSLNNVSTCGNVARQSLMLACVAALECLLTVEVVNDLTETPGEPNRQLIALGMGNLFAGMCGTMGGTSLIELTVMNVRAGGRRRLSSALPAIGILIIILFASPALKLIPCGTLAGILIDAVINTFKWESIPGVLAGLFDADVWIGDRQYKRIEPHDALIILITGALTWEFNLAYGVFAGMFTNFFFVGVWPILRQVWCPAEMKPLLSARV